MNLSWMASVDVRPWARALRAGLLLLVCVLIAVQVLPQRDRSGEGWMSTSDFVEYWGAGQLLRQGRDPYDADALYAIEQQEGWPGDVPLMMWNPPWLPILLYPLLLVPFRVAWSIWFVLSTFILLRCAALTWRFFVRPQPSVSGVIPLLAALLFLPSWRMIALGQVSVLMLLGIVGFLYFEEERRDLWAGASLALLTIKPHVTYLIWLTLAWWIITRRRWRVLGGLAGTLFLLGVLLLPFRPTWMLDYAAAIQHPPLAMYAPPVFGTLLRLLFGWDRFGLQYLPSSIMCVLTSVILIRRKGAFVWRDAIGPLMLLSVPTGAYGWSFDQIVLLLPYLQMVGWLAQRYHTHRGAVLVTALGLVAATGIVVGLGYMFRHDFFLLSGPLAWGGLYLAAQRMLGISGGET